MSRLKIAERGSSTLLAMLLIAVQVFASAKDTLGGYFSDEFMKELKDSCKTVYLGIASGIALHSPTGTLKRSM